MPIFVLLKVCDSALQPQMRLVPLNGGLDDQLLKLRRFAILDLNTLDTLAALAV